MLYWLEDEDDRGLEIYLRCVSCSHWGLFVTAALPRYRLDGSAAPKIARAKHAA